MAIFVVRLGSARLEGEGLRIGTVRRPPRGVPKAELAARHFYDIWLPELAPSEALLKMARVAGNDHEWRTFQRRYRAEMGRPPQKHLLALLAALSRHTNFSIGCFCAEEQQRSSLAFMCVDGLRSRSTHAASWVKFRWKEE